MHVVHYFLCMLSPVHFCHFLGAEFCVEAVGKFFFLAGIGGGVRFGGSSKVKLGFCFARFSLFFALCVSYLNSVGVVVR